MTEPTTSPSDWAGTTVFVALYDEPDMRAAVLGAWTTRAAAEAHLDADGGDDWQDTCSIVETQVRA